MLYFRKKYNIEVVDMSTDISIWNNRCRNFLKKQFFFYQQNTTFTQNVEKNFRTSIFFIFYFQLTKNEVSCNII